MFDLADFSESSALRVLALNHIVYFPNPPLTSSLHLFSLSTPLPLQGRDLGTRGWLRPSPALSCTLDPSLGSAVNTRFVEATWQTLLSAGLNS